MLINAVVLGAVLLLALPDTALATTSGPSMPWMRHQTLLDNLQGTVARILVTVAGDRWVVVVFGESEAPSARLRHRVRCRIALGALTVSAGIRGATF
jgi:hypothetical protein